MTMPGWLRVTLAVVAGIVVWFAVATAANVALRMIVEGYADAEPAMRFTLGMMIARLVAGAIASVAAGAAGAWVARRVHPTALALGVVLVVLFIPVHVRLWDTFPAWYHAVFLLSLVPLAWIGARLGARRPLQA
ncbi:MAG: hypothetical protein ACHQJ7_09840 [Vicinamibacteria bacterium]|jgi:hypothetical protein